MAETDLPGLRDADVRAYLDDVITPVETGWSPHRNLFRVYRLPSDCTADEVDSALTSVLALWGVPELREHTQAVDRLRRGHPVAVRVLSDPGERSVHRAAVAAERTTLAKVVDQFLRSAPGMPAAAVTALVRQSAGRWSRPDVVAALDQHRAVVREPASLDITPDTPRSRRITTALADLGVAGLWEYLTRRLSSGGSDVHADVLRDRRAQLRTRRGAGVEAELTVLKIVEQALDEPDGLSSLLRHEFLTELSVAVLVGYQEVSFLAAADPQRCVASGLPRDPETLAYALWCRRVHRSDWESDYRQAVADGRLHAALVVLSSRRLTGDWERVRDALAATVDRVAADLAAARELEDTAPEDAAARYLAADRELTDPAIKSGLRRCPARAPAEVSARAHHDAIVITWKESTSTAGLLTYRVSRGGTVIADDTDALALSDVPPAGVPTSYAVQTLRNGVPGGMAHSEEVVPAPEVLDLAVESTLRSVHGRWRLPSRAVGASVTRIAPTGEIAEVATPDGAGFDDTAVVPGVQYRYLVRARYPGQAGKPEDSAGLVVCGECPGNPRQVDDLRASLSGDTVELTWSRQSGTPLVIRVPHDGVAPAPQVLRAADAAVTGRVVAVSDTGRASVPLADLAGQRVLVPVAVSGPLAAIGPATRVTPPLEPVIGLHARRFGPQVVLSWQWPMWATDVRVVWRVDGPPTGPLDPQATVVEISRSAYEGRGARITATLPGEHWFGVSVVDCGRFGPMVTVSSTRLREVRYSVRRAAWWRRGELLVAVHGPEPTPDIAVVAKSGSRPLAPEDGVEVLRLPALGPPEPVRLRVPRQLRRPVFLRAFSLDETVALAHPAPHLLVVP
ncbi:hypothetical protein ABZ816_15885 [Actinosynnema sp. NPDC047251]|uniref:Fibronectin type-III domain-containing protein n=1 Tax=Saccharothrix espanaensis (strain ATCC 51144 / DSM 44229 / JCM 9112 / NBRC 15066 / NRRL 15764) TaxID=1179773 RepID=K0JVI9_SACES|nr:hypothetical protein [Saccharothrix espanaensis]CCH29497.1 hypothetical protein BN6_21750 [Saccharothrix espanaensis DSM 44229]